MLVVNSNNLTCEQVLGLLGVSKRAVESVQNTIVVRGDYKRYCRQCRLHNVIPQSFNTWLNGEE